MFLGRYFLAFSVQCFEGSDYAETRVARLDNVFYVTFLGSLVRVAEQIVVLLLLSFCKSGALGRIGFCLEFLAVNDAYSAFRSHDCEVGGWPCIIDVAAKLFAAHYDMGATVTLSKGDGHLRYRGLSVCVEEFCAI